MVSHREAVNSRRHHRKEKDRSLRSGALIYTAAGSYDRVWEIGVLIGFGAGTAHIFAGGPVNPNDHIAAPRLATE